MFARSHPPTAADSATATDCAASMPLKVTSIARLKFLFLIQACGGETVVDLTVKLRTDYQPLREFLSAEVKVDSEPQDLARESRWAICATG